MKNLHPVLTIGWLLFIIPVRQCRWSLGGVAGKQGRKSRQVRASKACSTPGCPNLQPCPEHRKVPWAGSTRRQRLPSDWERRRHSVLARDPICQACDNALAVEVDHITPSDDHSLTNLQGICRRCHRTKTQAEARAARGTA